MNWKQLNKNEANKIMQGWIQADEPIGLNRDFMKLRGNLIHSFESVMNNSDLDITKIKGNEYKIDLNFGLLMYEVLNKEYNFNMRLASTDGIWRYISIMVIPDIVEKRWGLKASRFWKDSRRMWLKTLWWYIHLSWQGSRENTYKILRTNTTDEIAQLVERSGVNGYRIDLYRSIMSEYGSISKEDKTRKSGLFRKIMKLNTIRTKVVEPGLTCGGIDNYVRELFEYFE